MTKKDYLKIAKAISELEDRWEAHYIADEVYDSLCNLNPNFPLTEEEWFKLCEV